MITTEEMLDGVVYVVIKPKITTQVWKPGALVRKYNDPDLMSNVEFVDESSRSYIRKISTIGNPRYNGCNTDTIVAIPTKLYSLFYL